MQEPQIAALARTGNSTASPPAPAPGARSECSCGSPSFPRSHRPGIAPHFLHNTGRPTRTLRPRPRQTERFCPSPSSSIGRNALSRLPGSPRHSSSSARAPQTPLCGSSETCPPLFGVSLLAERPTTVQRSSAPAPSLDSRLQLPFLLFLQIHHCVVYLVGHQVRSPSSSPSQFGEAIIPGWSKAAASDSISTRCEETHNLRRACCSCFKLGAT